jgi:hypothetical protein
MVISLAQVPSGMAVSFPLVVLYAAWDGEGVAGTFRGAATGLAAP